MQEFDAIQQRLGACRPYHSNQAKSTLQLKWERYANWIVIGMAVCFLWLVLVAIWKVCQLPVSNRVVSVAIWTGLICEALSLPWLLCQGRRQDQR